MFRMNWKNLYIAVSTVVIISLLAGVYVVYSQTPSSTFWLSAGIYPQANYTIWFETPNYFAKDLNGEIEFSGSNGSLLLQNCIDQLVSEGSAYAYGMIDVSARIQFLSSITLDSAIDLTDIINLEFMGVGRDNGIELIVEHNENIAFDLTNSRFIFFRNLSVRVSSGYRPSVVLYLARGTLANSIGDSGFYNVNFRDQGGVVTAFVYNYGGELITFRECSFNSNGTAININRDNYMRINSTFSNEAIGAQSMSMNDFRNCNFYNGAMTTEPIKLNAGTYNILFDHCYFGGGGANYAFLLNCTSGGVNKLTVKHCHFEMLGFTALGHPVSGRELLGFTLVDNTIYLPSAAAYVFADFNASNLLCREFRIEGNYQSRPSARTDFEVLTIDYSYVDFRLGLYDFTLNATNYIRFSRIIVENATHITCGGGYVAVNGTYFRTAGDFP